MYSLLRSSNLKSFLIVLICTLISMSLPANDLDYIFNGDFATYHDQRSGWDFNRSFCCFHVDNGSHYFFVGNIDNETKQEINYIVVVSKNENNEYRIDEIQGYSDNHPDAFKQSHFDLMNLIYMTTFNLDKISGKKIIEKNNGSGTDGFYTYDEKLPLFKCQKIDFMSQQSGSYELITTGRINYDQTELFFQFKPFKIEEFTIPGKAKLIDSDVKYENLFEYKIGLDDNWKYHDELNVPSYWISNYTTRDAMISIEEIDFSVLREMGIYTLEDFVSGSVYPYGHRIIADSLHVVESPNLIEVKKHFLDEQNHYNYAHNVYWLKDDTLYNFGFSAFAFMYDSRKDYFNKIIDSFLEENHIK